MDKDLLIYTDPGFLDKIGHYRNFARNIHEEAEKRNLEIWHFVNKEVPSDILQEYNLEKMFQHRAILKDDPSHIRSLILRSLMMIWGFCRSIAHQLSVLLPLKFKEKILISINNRFEKAGRTLSYNERVMEAFSLSLRAILDRVRSRHKMNKIFVYMYTSHPLYFPVFAKLINDGIFSEMNITAHLYLFYLDSKFCRQESPKKYKKLLGSVSNALEKYDPKGRVKLYSDSERTIQMYSPYFKRPLRLGPIPLCRNSGSNEPQMKNRGSQKLLIGFFGYTHVRQGYHLVKKLYEEIIKTKEYSHVHFIIRHNIHFLGYKFWFKRMITQFREQTQRITHLVGDLPYEEYEANLSKCDIIVMPHSKKSYPCQTSGLFIDALRKNKVVVVPKDTWMGDQLKQFGSGVTFESDHEKSFVNAAKEVIDHFGHYKAGTGRNLEAFLKFHSAGSLFDIIEINQTETERSVVN